MTKDVLAGLAAVALFAAITIGVLVSHQRFCLTGDLRFPCQVSEGFITILMPRR